MRAGVTGGSRGTAASLRHAVREVVPTVILVLAAAACGSGGDATEVEVEVAIQPHATQDCGSGFRQVALDHVVDVTDVTERFDANGSGVAIGDVDGDDRPDVVLGGLDGPVRLFSNTGDGVFASAVLAEVRTRAVQTVDVDGDGDLDVVVAPGLEAPVLLRNDGAGTFTQTSLPGVEQPAYAMLWLDPDGDGDLDLITGAYDQEFGRVIAREYVSEREVGVWFHRREDDGTFTSIQLEETAHVLALTTADLDGDAVPELVVGNDYGLEDAVWTWDDGWQPTDAPFSVTAANTMSFDVGDVDGDGDSDLYATDMSPYDATNEAFWRFLSERLSEPPGPQTIRNVLLDLGDEHRPDTARAAGVDATGWSWAGRLLDLDGDGHLDLYVANGMLPSPLLPGDLGEELVEENQAYRGLGDGTFAHADGWGLDLTAQTRGIAAGDLDRDGDLDLVASTVASPALILFNELCAGASVVVEPRWRDGPIPGTEVTVQIADDPDAPVRRRTIRSGIGYLSADEPIAHVGVGDAARVHVEVRWSDGSMSRVDDVDAGTRIVLTR